MWRSRSRCFLPPPLCFIELVDFVGPAFGDAAEHVVAEVIGNRRGGTDFIDRIEPVGQKIAARVFEQHDLAFGRHKHIARRVAHRIDLHVARAGRIAHVRRVEQDSGGQIAFFQFTAHGGEPVTLDLRNFLRQSVRNLQGDESGGIIDMVSVGYFMESGNSVNDR